MRMPKPMFIIVKLRSPFDLRFLSYTGTSVLPGGTYGPGTGTVYLTNVACSGNETGLLDCPNSGSIGATGCLHSQDVGVLCDPQLCKCNFSPTVFIPCKYLAIIGKKWVWCSISLPGHSDQFQSNLSGHLEHALHKFLLVLFFFSTQLSLRW